MIILGSSSKLVTLPVELRQQIFDHIPDLWSITSFRLTCKEFNYYYLQHKLDPRKHIIQQISQWYAFLTKRHLRPESLDTPAPGQQWTIEEDKAEYTLDILKHLPYFPIKDDFMNNPCPEQGLIDWRKDLVGEGVNFELQNMARMFEGMAFGHWPVDSRQGFTLTFGRGYWLDAMHARVYQPGERPRDDVFWPLDKFIELQCQHINALSLVYEPEARDPYEPGHGSRWVRLEKWKQSGKLEEERIALEEVCLKDGWPDNFDQQGLDVIQEWFDEHYQAYSELEKEWGKVDDWFDEYMSGEKL